MYIQARAPVCGYRFLPSIIKFENYLMLNHEIYRLNYAYQLYSNFNFCTMGLKGHSTQN